MCVMSFWPTIENGLNSSKDSHSYDPFMKPGPGDYFHAEDSGCKVLKKVVKKRVHKDDGRPWPCVKTTSLFMFY